MVKESGEGMKVEKMSFQYVSVQHMLQ